MSQKIYIEAKLLQDDLVKTNEKFDLEMAKLLKFKQQYEAMNKELEIAEEEMKPILESHTK